MKKVTIKAYAVSHKLSIFNVMKMIKSGKLKSEVIEENAKEVTYILLEEETEKEVRNNIIPFDQKDEASITEMIKKLQKEVKILREELEVIKQKI